VINRDFQSLCFTKTSPAVYIFVKNQRVSPHKKMWGGGKESGVRNVQLETQKQKLRAAGTYFQMKETPDILGIRTKFSNSVP